MLIGGLVLLGPFRHAIDRRRAFEDEEIVAEASNCRTLACLLDPSKALVRYRAQSRGPASSDATLSLTNFDQTDASVLSAPERPHHGEAILRGPPYTARVQDMGRVGEEGRWLEEEGCRVRQPRL